MSAICVQLDNDATVVKDLNKGKLTVSQPVFPVPRPARIPDLIPPQSDGILHRTLDGPSAARRRAGEEKSARCWLWRYPKISQWSTQITRRFCFIYITHSGGVLYDGVIIVGALLIFEYVFFSRICTKIGIESPVWPCGRRVWQHRTPRSRTGITSQRNSSLNPAPTRPVYVHAFLLSYMMHFSLIAYTNLSCFLAVSWIHAY